MRRPAREPDHVKRRADAAIRVGKTLGVNLRHPQHRGAAGRCPSAFEENIGGTHPPQILHQRERVVVPHHDAIDIGDRQREPRALQQPADVAQIGKRRDARRHPAFAFGLGGRKRLPQLGQRIAADHRREQQPVGPERAADLREHTGQIIHKLKGERGDDEVERFRLQRECFVVGIEIDPGDGFEAITSSQALTRRPDLRDIGKFPQHRMKALCHVFDDAVEQEGGGTPAQRTALPRPQEGAVEQEGSGGRVRGHTRVVRRSPHFWQSAIHFLRPTCGGEGGENERSKFEPGEEVNKIRPPPRLTSSDVVRTSLKTARQ